MRQSTPDATSSFSDEASSDRWARNAALGSGPAGRSQMRIAVVADIHANLTALDAVIADIRRIGADLVIHGGDLVGGGPRPAEVIDRIREMKWPGVYGNTDEMLWSPKLVTETLAAPPLHRIRDLLLAHTIPATIAAVGDERLH